MRKHYANFRENEEGKRFFYIDFGSEAHGRTSFRLWVSPRCLRKDEKGYFVEFPAQNCKVRITQKGNYVLTPAEGWWTADILIPCGYRGDGRIEKFLFPQEEELVVLKYYIFHSPLGRLGVDGGYIVSVPPAYDYLKYLWQRTGRTYGEPHSGCEILFKNGKREEIDGVCEDEELKELF